MEWRSSKEVRGSRRIAEFLEVRKRGEFFDCGHNDSTPSLRGGMLRGYCITDKGSYREAETN